MLLTSQEGHMNNVAKDLGYIIHVTFGDTLAQGILRIG
jgi:hypothetical protein